MQDLMQKLTVLGEAAKYDVSCSSSGVERSGKTGGVGSAASCGICHTWTEDGRCLSLLKVLLSNACVYDCCYCLNRCGSDTPKAAFTPQELADLTIEFYRRNYIEGLFLSSAVVRDPDYTMELLIRTLTILRGQHRFHGYVHAKVIPGASPQLVEKLGALADRVSVNMEFASKRSLKLLAGNKTHEEILAPMDYIRQRRLQREEENKKFRHTPRFAPAGQSTQLIVGATPERDLGILRLSDGLYSKFGLKRVFYSAYIPLATHPNLPAVTTMPPLRREHRLYQADWLLRFYGFTVSEIVDEQHPNLDLEVDPKVNFALNHRDLFPVEINRAEFEMLLRVPGIGVKSAHRIVAARRYGRLQEADLKKLGLVLKRARHFITVNGKSLGGCPVDSPFLREALKDGDNFSQMSLYDAFPTSAASSGSDAGAREEEKGSLLQAGTRLLR